MTENINTFNPELENELTKIEIEYIKKRIDIESNFSRNIGIVLSVFLLIFAILGGIQSSRIDALQEQVLLSKCELSAQKENSNFVFVADADKSECNLQQ